MPGVLAEAANRRKRRRDDAVEEVPKKSRKAPKSSQSSDEVETEILLLESEILEGNQHLNNIVTLQSIVNKATKHPSSAIAAAVALCRVFCRLIAGERLIPRRHDSEESLQVVRWLKARLREYAESLALWIGKDGAALQDSAITILMRLVKEETAHDPKRAEQAWRSEKAVFCMLINALLKSMEAESARKDFVGKYVDKYDDVRFYTMLAIPQCARTVPEPEYHAGTALEILTSIQVMPKSEDELEKWLGQPPASESHRLVSLSSHRKVAQDCWLSIFRSPLTASQRKTTLSHMNSHILPWFATRMEILTDFLNDCFNAGGALSLLALSGIFHLMTERNLDYPEFYTKLYSLLDREVLHSTHRSRFFRLLDKFMSSSHLPAAMVASFIKRLGRLALQAPPGAIVWIVPWTYNLFRAHPACTFLLHRPYHTAHAIYASNPNFEDEGMDDPFSMSETDPMLTNAIHSSLWEFHTLQSHWHPNVATLARILGEQFTKREYVLEDFLDHSYSTLVEAELKKEVKKKPETEWEIPKRIVTAESDGSVPRWNDFGTLLDAAIRA